MTKRNKGTTRKQMYLDQAQSLLTVARRLSWLADRSLQVVEHLLCKGGGLPDLDDEYSNAEVLQLASVWLTRFRAEAEIFNQAADMTTPIGVFKAEYQCMLKALNGVSNRLTKDAELLFDAAGKSARGRPRASAANPLCALANGLPYKPKHKARVGRPQRVKISNESLLQIVEERLAGKENMTVREAVSLVAQESLQRELGTDVGWRYGKELQKMIQNLEKRVSALRRKGNRK